MIKLDDGYFDTQNRIKVNFDLVAMYSVIETVRINILVLLLFPFLLGLRR